MKFPAATAALSVSYARDLNQYSSTKHFNLSVNIPPPRVIPAAGGTCYCIRNDKGDCIVSGNNCHDGSPECIDYRGMCNCACRD